LGGDGYAGAVFWVTCTRFLSGQERGRNVRGVRVGWDVSEEVGRVWKYAIFIACIICEKQQESVCSGVGAIFTVVFIGIVVNMWLLARAGSCLGVWPWNWGNQI
jgi:hypothetical protein